MQGYREEIRQISLQIQAQGVPQTQKHIALHMTQLGILRDPKVRELLRDVCYEVERGTDAVLAGEDAISEKGNEKHDRRQL